MEEMPRIVNLVGLEVMFYLLWPFEPACAVLLDQKNLTLSCAQDQVKKATEEDMPELVAVLLEYINRTFTQEELDLEREKRQKVLLADL